MLNGIPHHLLPSPKSVSLSQASRVHDFICLIIFSLGNAGFVSETTRMCWANAAPRQAASGLCGKASYAGKLPRSCFLMRSSFIIWSCLIWWTGLNTRALLWPNKRADFSECFCNFLGLRFCAKVGIHSLNGAVPSFILAVLFLSLEVVPVHYAMDF